MGDAYQVVTQVFCTVVNLANTRNGRTTKAYAGHYSTLALPAS